jgi:transposase
VTATMTFAGLDVHARSIHAAAIDVQTGELRRVRFGARSEEAISWLQALPQPVRACYEAGPTGFALYRAAEAAGVPVEVVAPSKTPRAPGDRIKTDRKDAELLARLLLAGQLKFVTVPSTSFEAAGHLCRAREQVRSDLMRCRHRVSKLLLCTAVSTRARAPGRRRTAAGSTSSASTSRRPSSLPRHAGRGRRRRRA